MSINAALAADRDPLLYQPIKIIDISPYRSSIRQRPAGTRPRRRIRRDALTVAAGLGFLRRAVGIDP